MRYRCNTCGRVFLMATGDYKITKEDIDRAVCPFCGSKHIREFKGDTEVTQ